MTDQMSAVGQPRVGGGRASGAWDGVPGEEGFPGEDGDLVGARDLDTPGAGFAGLSLMTEMDLADVVAAAERYLRYRDGEGDGPVQGLRGRTVGFPVFAAHASDIVAPGPALAGCLTASDGAGQDDATLVTAITGWRKLTSWAQARELAAVAELARRRGVVLTEDGTPADGIPGIPTGGIPTDSTPAGGIPTGGIPTDSTPSGSAAPTRATAARARASGEDALRPRVCSSAREAEFAPDELALALTLTRRAAGDWMDLAVSLSSRLPQTLAALDQGQIDLYRAKLIHAYTGSLDAELAAQVEARVLPKASGQTSGRLAAALQRAVLAVDPGAAERRREEAESSAQVQLWGDHDGTAALGGRFLPVAQATAAWARISAMAKAWAAAGATGGMDLLRAHVFIGLLLGTLPLIPPADGDPGAGTGPGGGDGNTHPHNPRPHNPAAAASGADSPGAGHPAPGTPDAGATATDRPATDHPATDHPATDHPATDRPGPDARGRGGRETKEVGPSGDAQPVTGLPRSGLRDGEVGPDGGPWAGLPDPRDEDYPGDDDWDDGHQDDDPRSCAESGPPLNAGPPGQSPGRHLAREATMQASRPWPHIRAPGEPPSPGCAAGWPDVRAPTNTQVCGSGLRLSVSLRTLLGISGEPGRLGRIGPVTGRVARALAAAAASDPTCPWQVTITDHHGQVIGVARGRRITISGPAASHRFPRGPGSSPSGPGSFPSGPGSGLSLVTVVVTMADLATGPGRVRASAVHPSATTPAGRFAAEAGSPGTDLRARVESVIRAARRTVERHSRARQTGQPGDGSAALPPTGCAHNGATPGYRFPPLLRRFLEARDQTCTNPICRQPAHRCDIDHTIPWDAGGPTCRCNGGPACRRHHRMKQLAHWRLSQPRPGTFEWRTPAGLTYISTPEPYRT